MGLTIILTEGAEIPEGAIGNYTPAKDGEPAVFTITTPETYSLSERCTLCGSSVQTDIEMQWRSVNHLICAFVTALDENLRGPHTIYLNGKVYYLSWEIEETSGGHTVQATIIPIG